MDKTIRIQCVLYHPDPAGLRRLFESMAKVQIPEGHRVEIALGDCSEEREIEGELLAELVRCCKNLGTVDYRWFRQNLGYGAGHNLLFKESPSEFLLLLNPDCLLPDHVLARLVRKAASISDFGIAEARQIPLEHPKAFDPSTGRTSWATGCCSLVNGPLFRKVGGFDETFFMYCEDVDLSWRMRAAGASIYYCTDTFVYHSKGLNIDGIVVSEAEATYSPLGNMILYRKYGRERLLAQFTEAMRREHPERFVAIERQFEERLPIAPASDAERKVADFEPDGTFGPQRWQYQRTIYPEAM